MKNSLSRHYASMIFVNIMWGLSFIASKYAMNAGFPPITLALARYVLATMVLIPAVLLKEKKFKLRKKDILPMFLSGLFGISLYYLFEYEGIARTTTVNASLILAAIPILTMIAERIFLKSKLYKTQIIGALLSLIGVFMIVYFGSSEGESSLIGNLLVMGASIVWVGYIFISRKLRENYSSLSMNAWQAVTALFTLAPMALTEKSEWQPVAMDGWIAVMILAFICSALCYFIYGNSLKALSPLASAIFINLIPLVTILGGVLFLKESIGPLQIFGGVLIILSIFLVTMTGDSKKSRDL